MRIGSLFTRLVVLAAIAVASCHLIARSTQAQGYQPQAFPATAEAAAPTRPIQALFLNPIGAGQSNSYVDAYGNSVVVPASYSNDVYGERLFAGIPGRPTAVTTENVARATEVATAKAAAAPIAVDAGADVSPDAAATMEHAMMAVLLAPILLIVTARRIIL